MDMNTIEHKSISDVEYYVVDDINNLHVEVEEKPGKIDTCEYRSSFDIRGDIFPSCSRLPHNTIINKNCCELCSYYKEKCMNK